MNKFVFYFLIFVLLGCAQTLKDIRTGHPNKIIELNISANSIANCLYYEMLTENDNKWTTCWNKVDIINKNNIYYLSLTSTGGLFYTQTVAIGEIIIKSNKNYSSIIEIRASGNLTVYRILEYINKSASSQNAPGK